MSLGKLILGNLSLQSAKYSIASVSSFAGKSVSENPISNSILNKKNFNKMLSSTDHRWKAWRGEAHLLIQIKRQHLLGPLNRPHNSCSYWTPQAKMTTAGFNCKEAATVEGRTKWSERPQPQTITTVANPPPSLRSWFITGLSKLMLCFPVWISKLT